jgi:hypothetical protein
MIEFDAELDLLLFALVAESVALCLVSEDPSIDWASVQRPSFSTTLFLKREKEELCFRCNVGRMFKGVGMMLSAGDSVLEAGDGGAKSRTLMLGS